MSQTAERYKRIFTILNTKSSANSIIYNFFTNKKSHAFKSGFLDRNRIESVW